MVRELNVHQCSAIHTVTRLDYTKMKIWYKLCVFVTYKSDHKGEGSIFANVSLFIQKSKNTF